MRTIKQTQNILDLADSICTTVMEHAVHEKDTHMQFDLTMEGLVTAMAVIAYKHGIIGGCEHWGDLLRTKFIGHLCHLIDTENEDEET